MIRAICFSLLVASVFSAGLEETFLSRIPEGAKVLQFGTSTKSGWLAKRYLLCTVESKIEEINEHDSEYVFAPLADGWYSRDEIAKFAPTEYDCILINSGVHQKGILKNLDLLSKRVPIFVQSDKDLARRLSKGLNNLQITP